MEDQNVSLDDLHMDILEKHHRDNMQIMASMLARVGSNGMCTPNVSGCIRYMIYPLYIYILQDMLNSWSIAKLCTPLYIGVATN